MIEQRKRRENGEKGVTNTKRNERRKFWWNYFWRTSNKKSFCPVNLRNKNDWRSDDLKSNFRLKWNSTLNQVVFLHSFVDTDASLIVNIDLTWNFQVERDPIVSVDWSVDKNTILDLDRPWNTVKWSVSRLHGIYVLDNRNTIFKNVG